MILIAPDETPYEASPQEILPLLQQGFRFPSYIISLHRNESIGVYGLSHGQVNLLVRLPEHYNKVIRLLKNGWTI